MKYSRATLAKAYMSLRETYSSKALAKGFAEIFIQQHKEREVEIFGEEVADLWADTHSSVFATVVSARELSKKAKERIVSYIQRAENRKHVDGTYAIDPTLMGGAIIQTATHTYTFSTAEKIHSIL